MGDIMPRKRQDTSLFKIIVVIVVIGGVAAGVLRVAKAFQDHLDRKVEAAAIDNLEKARALVADGNAVEAGKLLRPILDRVDNPDISPKARMLQAELELANGNSDAALEHLRAATEDFPESPEQPVAALKYARLLERLGHDGRAFDVYTRIRDTAPPALRAPALIALGERAEAQGDTDAAYALYARAMEDADVETQTWFEAARHYGAINVARIFSTQPTPDSKVYRVENGDSLTTIGIKLNTTQGLLMKANNLDNPNLLRPSQNLKYTPKDFEIVIERSALRLYLLDKNGVFNVYRVGLGKPGNDTTLGRYRIGNKEVDPTWFKPGFGAIPPGDPRNELGTRWMPLIPEEENLPTDLGIHGTIDPPSVGKYSSMGCPRLVNEQVEELYDLVVRSTPVTIVEHFDPEART